MTTHANTRSGSTSRRGEARPYQGPDRRRGVRTAPFVRLRLALRALRPASALKARRAPPTRPRPPLGGPGTGLFLRQVLCGVGTLTARVAPNAGDRDERLLRPRKRIMHARQPCRRDAHARRRRPLRGYVDATGIRVRRPSGCGARWVQGRPCARADDARIPPPWTPSAGCLCCPKR
jgi:hypothetical protein